MTTTQLIGYTPGVCLDCIPESDFFDESRTFTYGSATWCLEEEAQTSSSPLLNPSSLRTDASPGSPPATSTPAPSTTIPSAKDVAISISSPSPSPSPSVVGGPHVTTVINATILTTFTTTATHFVESDEVTTRYPVTRRSVFPVTYTIPPQESFTTFQSTLPNGQGTTCTTCIEEPVPGWTPGSFHVGRTPGNAAAAVRAGGGGGSSLPPRSSRLVYRGGQDRAVVPAAVLRAVLLVVLLDSVLLMY